MGFYIEVLILGINTMYMLFCFFKLFLIGCIGLNLDYDAVYYNNDPHTSTDESCSQLLPTGVYVTCVQQASLQNRSLLQDCCVHAF